MYDKEATVRRALLLVKVVRSLKRRTQRTPALVYRTSDHGTFTPSQVDTYGTRHMQLYKCTKTSRDNRRVRRTENWSKVERGKKYACIVVRTRNTDTHASPVNAPYNRNFYNCTSCFSIGPWEPEGPNHSYLLQHAYAFFSGLSFLSGLFSFLSTCSGFVFGQHGNQEAVTGNTFTMLQHTFPGSKTF